MIIIKVLIIVMIFKITTTATIIITDYYSKLIRSGYKCCFPQCSFCDKKKMLFKVGFSPSKKNMLLASMKSL